MSGSYPIAARLQKDKKEGVKPTFANFRQASKTVGVLVDLQKCLRVSKKADVYYESALKNKQIVSENGLEAERRHASIELAVITAFRENKLDPELARFGKVAVDPDGTFYRQTDEGRAVIEGLRADFPTPPPPKDQGLEAAKEQRRQRFDEAIERHNAAKAEAEARKQMPYKPRHFSVPG